MNIMIQYRPLQGPSYIPFPNEPTVDTDFGMAIMSHSTIYDNKTRSLGIILTAFDRR